MALSGKWSVSTSEVQQSATQPQTPETLEAEVVEPVEVGGQK